jgi:hypothetical protein
MAARLESDDVMHVIDRKTRCGFCMKRRATYDVSPVFSFGSAPGSWVASCGSCARKYRERLKLEAEERQESIRRNQEWLEQQRTSQ